MTLKLIKANQQYQKEITEMINEWKTYNDTHITNTSPFAIFKNNCDDFDYYINNLDITNPTTNLVPSSVFFCLDEERNIIVGAIDIRHYLNDYLLMYGGHIGDGIRPSERRKGYATKMLNLALEECKKLNIDKVLLICDKTNVGSAKSIINNGGILENEIEHDGKIIQRYWINLY